MENDPLVRREGAVTMVRMSLVVTDPSRSWSPTVICLNSVLIEIHEAHAQTPR